MALRFVVAAIRGEFEKEILKIQEPIAKAATAAVKEADKLVKAEASAELRGIGFSTRSSKAMRSVITPKTGDSINISADFFLRPAYLNVFEEGAAIHGKPLLWLPLDTVPLGVGGKRLTPRQYIDRIGPLHSVRGASKPLLVGKGSRSTILRATSKLVRFRKGALGRGQPQGQVNVPLFVGISAAIIRKKTDLAGIVRRISGRLGELYLKNFKAQ